MGDNCRCCDGIGGSGWGILKAVGVNMKPVIRIQPRSTTRLAIAIALVLANLTVAAAPRQKFNPDEALGFLETLGTIQMYDTPDKIVYYTPDVYLLARLFDARHAPGGGDKFVEAVEGFVASGLLLAKRQDLYQNRVKPHCDFLDTASFELKVTKRCENCRNGKVYRDCSKCEGSGKCPHCNGYGRVRTNITTMYDSRFPGDTKIITQQCGSCEGSGQCKFCIGAGKVEGACTKCMGRGRFLDKKSAAHEYVWNALSLIKYLCDVGDKTDMPALLKRDFKKAREKAEKKFDILREAREDDEAEEQRERERQEQAERERREREEKAERERKEREEQEAFEAEQRAKGLVKYGGKWMTPDEKRLAEKEAETAVCHIVNEVLETNKRGDVDYRYCDPNLTKMLYAPRSWEIVNANVFGETAAVTVRVDSSNKGGAQITVIWVYYLSLKSGSWKVINIVEKQ